MPRWFIFLPIAVAAAMLAGTAATVLAQEQSFPLTIKNHRFESAEFEVPATVKVKLHVKNENVTPEDVESSTLRREKVIPGGKEASIFAGLLSPGRYEFVGDFNRETPRGSIIVK